MTEYEEFIEVNIVLEKEGVDICYSASREFVIWMAVSDYGKIGIRDLSSLVDAEIIKDGVRYALKKGWVRKEGAYLVIGEDGDDVVDKTKQVLDRVRRMKTLDGVKVLDEIGKRK